MIEEHTDLIDKGWAYFNIHGKDGTVDKTMTNHVISVDPGKHTGWAWLDFGGVVKDKGVLLFEDAPDFIETIDTENLTHIVCEDFHLYRGKALQQSGSQMETSQVIGMLRSFCHRHHIPLVLQSPEARLLGARFVGYRVSKGHMNDSISAWLHGVYFLRKIGKYTIPMESHGQMTRKKNVEKG